MDNSTFVFRVVVVTLAAILVSVIAAMLIGLFDPLVDNDKIFEILGPAFATVVGAFVGVLSTAHRRQNGPIDSPPSGTDDAPSHRSQS